MKIAPTIKRILEKSYYFTSASSTIGFQRQALAGIEATTSRLVVNTANQETAD